MEFDRIEQVIGGLEHERVAMRERERMISRLAEHQAAFPAQIALLVLLIVAVFSAPAVEAASITLQPVADTTLQEAFLTNNYGDGTTIQAGEWRYGGRTRALLPFDLQAASLQMQSSPRQQ
jgi:hypothetical protein